MEGDVGECAHSMVTTPPPGVVLHATMTSWADDTPGSFPFSPETPSAASRSVADETTRKWSDPFAVDDTLAEDFECLLRCRAMQEYLNTSTHEEDTAMLQAEGGDDDEQSDGCI